MRDREPPWGYLNVEKRRFSRWKWERMQGKENDYWMAKPYRDIVVFSSRDPRDVDRTPGSMIGVALRDGREDDEIKGSVIWTTKEERDAKKARETDGQREDDHSGWRDERRRERDWGPSRRGEDNQRRDDDPPPHDDRDRDRHG